jgi:hypothetical protein
MGLAISVGFLIEMNENDEEGAKWFKKNLNTMNRVLKREGLPLHKEPEQSQGLPWWAEMHGYSGIHHLRRIAAYRWRGLPLPQPTSDPAKDPVLVGIYKTGVPLLKFAVGGKPPPGFSHLINHSDAEGFYLPIDFPEVIHCEEDEIPGGMIGSVPRLRSELEILVKLLEVPMNMDPEGKEVFDAAESRPIDGPRWRKYGIESFVLLRLWRACELSLLHRSAIVFH